MNKVSSKKIKALMSDLWDSLPEVAFAKSLLQSKTLMMLTVVGILLFACFFLFLYRMAQ